MLGRAVQHKFENDGGSKDEWRGMVLARAPIMTPWFYITYEKDPVLYMYKLFEDIKSGDLRFLPGERNMYNLLPLKVNSLTRSRSFSG